MPRLGAWTPPAPPGDVQQVSVGANRLGRRVVLHIGTMKSGTTSIQSLLFSQRRALADQGVLPLGDRWGDQVAGTRELIAHPDAPGEPWQRLVKQAACWDVISVLSMEFLGPFIPRRVQAAVQSFGDLPVHVVLTMRDLNRTIPSLWQEAIQNGREWSWHDYLAGARDARPWQRTSPTEVAKPGRTFWRQQNACQIAHRWGRVVGSDRLSLVTLPPPGAPRSTLVERFGRAVGFDTSHMAEARTKNESLGAASAQMLQRVNAHLAASGLASSEAQYLRKRLLAKQVLSARRDQERAIGLDVSPWVVETSAEMVVRLQRSGLRLVGDWADLTPVAAPGVDPADTPGDELIAAARYGYEGLQAHLAERSGRDAASPWPDPADAEGAVEALAGLVLAHATREPE